METPGTTSVAPDEFLAGVTHGRRESAFREIDLRLKLAAAEEQLSERGLCKQDSKLTTIAATVVVMWIIILAGMSLGIVQ